MSTTVSEAGSETQWQMDEWKASHVKISAAAAASVDTKAQALHICSGSVDYSE